MAFGLFSHPASYALVCLVVLGLFQASVDARPKDTDVPAADDLSGEWREAADLITPDDDKVTVDSWRAFPPSKIKSTSRWWEAVLEDNPWDVDSYEDESDEEESSEENDNDSFEEEDYSSSSSSSSSDEDSRSASSSDEASSSSSSDEDFSSSSSDEDFSSSSSDEDFSSSSSEEDDTSSDEMSSDSVESKERCRVDYECRSGRTCVEGVCKCFRRTLCAGHYKPVCGSDGVEYPSHCELHRTSCLNRVRIRVDRTGRCFKSQIIQQEKSWLLDQERRLQKEEEKRKNEQQRDNSVHIPAEIIKEFPANEIKIALDEEPSTTTFPSQQQNRASHSGEKCTWDEMAKFKEDLLLYHCVKFVEPNCQMEVKTSRQYLSMLMFSYYDSNFDFFLTADELRDKERDEHFTDKIIKNCHLQDFVKFSDIDQSDAKLTVSEFTQSFQVMKPSSPSVPTNVEVVSTLASAGDGLELKCGVKAARVVWRRYGVQLEDDKKNHKVVVFGDGALFFSKLSLHHIGNYTCMDTLDEKNAQVHKLSIQTSPIVEVSPSSQTDISGSDVELRCHSEGVPKPTITWKHNGRDVLNNKHVSVYTGREHIVIHNAQQDKDAGKYVCSAHSQAGTTEKSVSVKIVPPVPFSNSMMRNEGTFLVFHDKGITAYDPLRCLARHKVKGDFGKFKFIPDAMNMPLTLCKGGKSCQWGDAVKVGSEFVYVSQPDQNRVLVVEAGHYWNPLQVIDTDQRPEKLQYVPHLDQVWVLCHSQATSGSDKTVVVIRDASQQIQHRSVHTRPVGNHFDTVEDLFIAAPNDLRHEFDHGYVTHAGKTSLFKINLEDMSYTHAIDLSKYSCVPVTVAFVPLGGHVVIQCVSQTDQHSLQLVMDYLTNTVMSIVSLSGKPIVSPDSRHLITVDQFSGKVVVVSISNEGQMETTYEVTVSASISDVSFIPSTYHHGYDLILTSADDDDLIVMNLVTGKVEKMSGSSQFEASQSWHPTPVFRKIVSGDPMSKYVMSPSKSSLAIINFQFKHMECEFSDITGYNVVVHVSSPRTTS